MRQTNKRIISELLPVLREAVQHFLKNKETLSWQENRFRSGPKRQIEMSINGLIVTYEDFGDQVWISVTKRLYSGKFDHATLTAVVYPDNRVSETLGYSKEFVGMGNGFYADVHWNGKIIRSEWD